MLYFIYLLLVILMLGLDQASKYFIVNNFDLYESKEIINNFFNITYVRNYGAGFSIMQNQTYVFFVITIVALTIISYLLYKSKDNEILNRVSYILIIGGALGNFIDRLHTTYVVDFLDFNLFGWAFPVFNIADCFITVGAFILIISTLIEGKHAKN